VARYLGMSDRDLYAFEVQIIGKGGLSRMLITSLGPDEMKSRAMGFRVVEALSAKTHILKYILEPPAQGPEWAGGGQGGEGDKEDGGTGGPGDLPGEGDGDGRPGGSAGGPGPGTSPVGGVDTRGRREWK